MSGALGDHDVATALAGTGSQTSTAAGTKKPELDPFVAASQRLQNLLAGVGCVQGSVGPHWVLGGRVLC